MMKPLPLITLVAMIALAPSCATSPDKISPQYVSDIQYMELDCAQMAAEQGRLVSALAEASRAQSTARSNDAWGVLLIGVPTASLSGSNQAGYVARLKGEIEALQRAAVKKRCGLEAVSPDEIIENSKAMTKAEFRERQSKSPRDRLMDR